MSQLRKTLDDKTHSKNAVFIGGILAGAGEVVFTYPLDTIKTQLQLQPKKYTGILNCGTSIITNTGGIGLYYGVFPSLLQVAGKSGIRFTIYDFLCNKIKDKGKISNKASLISGLLAGAAEALIWTAPTERIKILQQKLSDNNQRYKSTFNISKDIIKNNGITGLYTGTVPTIIKQSLSVGVRFYLYNLLKNTFINPEKSPKRWETVIIGGISGCLSTVINHPVDVVKSHIQAQEGKKTNIIKTTKELVNKNGYSVLLKGLNARFVRVGLAQSITFTIYESFLSYYEN